MPVRDLRSNTVYWGADGAELLALGTADTQIQLASDYEPNTRIFTSAAASVVPGVFVYRGNSADPQTLTVTLSGYYKAGDVLTVVQEGAGAITIAPATGVTIDTSLSGLVTQAQWNVAQLIYIGSNHLVAVGGLGA